MIWGWEKKNPYKKLHDSKMKMISRFLEQLALKEDRLGIIVKIFTLKV
jgi:cytochrome c1